MATEAQIQANRRNSQKSTGPRTDAGKLTSSQNAFKSGIYAEAPIVTGENPDDLDGLASAYHATWNPSNPDEQALVDTLVHTDWLTRRMRRVETQQWNRRTDQLHDDDWYKGDPKYELAATWAGIQQELDRIQRRLSALERVYYRTLTNLRRLRADRPLPADPAPEPEPQPKPITPATIGFVPSELPALAASPAPQIGFVPSNHPPARREAAAVAKPQSPTPTPLYTPCTLSDFVTK